jgi:carbamoyl-phosphate synthase small subunit
MGSCYIHHQGMTLLTKLKKNGPVFHGISFGANRNISGEAVFSTAIVGYPESMTDPSYKGQILVFTQPLVGMSLSFFPTLGNYGVPSPNERDEYNLLRYFESPTIQCAGIIVADYATKYSHWTAVESLSSWCSRSGIPAVSGVDTRAIVTFLRERGSSLARIVVGEEYDADEDEAFMDPGEVNLVKQVCTKHPFHVETGTSDLKVALIDCGVKENIIRSLVRRGASVTVYPYDYPIQNVASQYDGIFLSNGPGDPTHCNTTVANLRTLFDIYSKPIFGICLGHQLLSLAAGAKTIKLKYGNRAQNIPALDLMTGRCHITSQNHGYAVDVTTLPSGWNETWRNVNDGSNEGVSHQSRPIGSVQFHPEAKGGPQDTDWIFDRYVDTLREMKGKEQAIGIQREAPLAGAMIA